MMCRVIFAVKASGKRINLEIDLWIIDQREFLTVIFCCRLVFRPRSFRFDFDQAGQEKT